MSTNFWESILATPLLGTPGKFTKRYISEVVARGDRRIANLEQRLDDVVASARVLADRDDITIGSGQHFQLAILFLDICGSSNRPNWTLEEQKQMLKLMDVFMAEMLSIVHDFGGRYEKNTGDGLMAYFGGDEKTVQDKIKPAVEAAVIMHYVNDQILSPWLKGAGIEPVSFRIGIDYGPVTIARVGIHGEKSSRVAIGTPANIANKLMNRIPNGGVCIGDTVRLNLPHNWAAQCRQCTEPSGFIWVATQQPYTAWELNHRLSPPTF